MNFARDVQISPVAPAGFATLAEVKARLGVSGEDFDTEISALILAASDMIEGYCGAIFTQRTVTETIIENASVRSIVLKHCPVISLTSIELDGTAQVVADFRVEKANGIIRRVDRAAIGTGEHVLVYEAGYADGTLPAAIKTAAHEQIKALWQIKDRVAGVSRESVPDVADVSYSADAFPSAGVNGVSVPAVVGSLLAPYVVRFGL